MVPGPAGGACSLWPRAGEDRSRQRSGVGRSDRRLGDKQTDFRVTRRHPHADAHDIYLRARRWRLAPDPPPRLDPGTRRDLPRAPGRVVA